MKIKFYGLAVIAVTAVSLWGFKTNVKPTVVNTITPHPENNIGVVPSEYEMNQHQAHESIDEPINGQIDNPTKIAVATASNSDGESKTVAHITLPGDDIEFKLQLNHSDFHTVNGIANSTIGETAYTSRLLPSNEVELKLVLIQDKSNEQVMKAYFDLANYKMELDGGNSVLNQDHKQLIKTAAEHLRHHFMQQYDGMDVPEHAFMLVQMLSYWSMAPEGFVYEKRIVTSR